nr:N-methyl-L-tryptophan oxidase [Ktedonobacteraceae bacterium]
ILLTDNLYSAILHSIRHENEKEEEGIIVRQQQVVIVGAGIVGLSTAYALLAQGLKHVIVLEQEAVDHRRAASHGVSRLLRFEYGEQLYYSEMVRRSLDRWHALEHISKRTLYTPTGLLVLGTERDNFAQPSYQVMRELHLPTERLSRQDCQQRFPQFSTQGNDIFTYNAEGGILHASACVQTLKDLIIDLGGTIYESCRVTAITHDNLSRPIRIHTSTGDTLIADQVVLATGAWVHRLLADLRLPVQLTRQYLLHFAGLPSTSFGNHAFPAFITADLYGFPLHKSPGCQGYSFFKAASHSFGSPIDPDDILPPEERVLARITQSLQDLLPALQEAELVRVDSCMYDVTPDEDFILDHVPYDPRITFATGLSGHGFKFGPLLGEMLGCMVCGLSSPVSLERFQLARFSRQHISVA